LTVTRCVTKETDAVIMTSSEVTVVLLAAVVILVLLIVIKLALDFDRRRSSPKIDLPGPRGLPFIGNAFQLNRRRPWETMAAWRSVYGDAYVIRLFSESVVVLCGHETIREALIERGRDFAGRPRPFFRAGFMADGYQDVVSGSPEPVWTALRRAVQRAMRSADPSGGSGGGAGRWTEKLTISIVDEMCEELAETGGRPFDPRTSVYHAIMNMTCMMLIGDRFQREDDELTMYKRLERLVTTSMSIGGRGSELDLFPWLRYFGNATYRKLVEAKQLRDVLYDRIRERIGDLGPSSLRRGVVHALFDALADDLRENTSGVTENHLKLAIVNLLVGGAAATTGYIYAAINILAQHPDVQAEIRAEVDKVLSQCVGQRAKEEGNRANAVLGGRAINLDDKPSMPYTSATIIELLRYASLSPILIPHRTMVETKIGATSIPPGVQVFLHARAVHHDHSFWIDPYRFRPERFLEQDDDGCDEKMAAEIYAGKQQTTTDAASLGVDDNGADRSVPHGPKWRLIPMDDARRRRVMSFGGGPRACPGEAVALTRLFLTISNVVRRFVIEQQPETDSRTIVAGESMTDVIDWTSQSLPTSLPLAGRLRSCDPRSYEPGLVLSPTDFQARFISRS